MPATRITVYSGIPAELMRALDWLSWNEKPIHLAQDHVDVVARLRAGQIGNRALIDGGKGLLEGPLWPVLPGTEWAAMVEEYIPRDIPVAEMDPNEREWMMRGRELTDEQRAALLVLLRGLRRDALAP